MASGRLQDTCSFSSGHIEVPRTPLDAFFSRNSGFVRQKCTASALHISSAMARDAPEKTEKTGEPGDSPSYDKLIKAFLKPHYVDFCELLLGRRPDSVEEIETTHALARSRSTDKFLRVRFGGEPGLLLHFEVQLQGRANVPFRVGEYMGYQLWHFDLAAKEGLLPACVVVYLDKKVYREDPGFYELKGASRFRFLAQYDVVKLWELSPERVLSMKSPGLCPFLPLLRGKPEDLVVRSVQKIRNAPEEDASMVDKGLLLVALEALARRVMGNNKLLEEILSEPEFYKASSFYKRGHKEGEEQGEQRGELKGEQRGEEKALRESILDILEERFGEVPEDLRARVNVLHDLRALKSLVRSAASALDLQAFRAALAAIPS